MTALSLHNPGLPIQATPVHTAHAGPQDLGDFLRVLVLAWDSDQRQVREDVVRSLCRGMLDHEDSPVAVSRTWDASTGPLGGFLIKPQWVTDFWDKVRSTAGLLAGLGFLEPASARELHIPGYNESDRRDKKRWGGAFAYWQGQQETKPLQANLPAANDIIFSLNRLVLFSGLISRDLAADSFIFKKFLDYAYYRELRYQLEGALLVGDNIGMPQGAVNAAATISVAKDGSQTGGTISANNVDGMWERLWGASKKNAIWLANEDTVYQLDQGVTTAGWPRALYVPAGESQTGIPLIKARPLYPAEQLPVVGQPGDLLLIDPTQYGMVYHAMAEGTDAGLEVTVGLPNRSVENITSEHFYFDQDALAIRTKLRADGHCMWQQPMTIADGSITVGPSCVIAVRS